MRWLADENFNGDIVRGLKHRFPEFDIVRVQDVGLAGSADPLVLTWAAEQQRLLLTHDVRTMTRYAYARADQGLLMPGMVQVRRTLPLQTVIEQVLLMDSCGFPGEWEGQVVHLPF